MHDDLRAEIELKLAPFKPQLGADYLAYEHHVLRVLRLCDRQHRRTDPSDALPSGRPEYAIAAVFHDLGIWTERTFDYLHPSIELARAWLIREDREDLAPLVTAMIEQHHKLRPAATPASPVEVFRRADTIDVSLGLRRFGVPLRDYRAIARRYPDAGFHRRLIALAWKRLQTHPTSPLPMVRW